MNGYVAFVEGVRHEVYADTSYQASQAARELYTGRKRHPSVSVTLCEQNGQELVQVAT